MLTLIKHSSWLIYYIYAELQIENGSTGESRPVGCIEMCAFGSNNSGEMVVFVRVKKMILLLLLIY